MNTLPKCLNCGSGRLQTWTWDHKHAITFCAECAAVYDSPELEMMRRLARLRRWGKVTAVVLVLLAGAALLGGCHRMVKPSATPEEARRDEAECLRLHGKLLRWTGPCAGGAPSAARGRW